MKGKRVLDTGCGEGYLSRKLARLGAGVTGVDLSREMLVLAEERTDKSHDIEYWHGDCQSMDFLEADSFDIVVSNMVLQDLPDHRADLRSIHRVLVTGGLFLFSITHPCFVTPGCGWVRSDEASKLYWKTGRYDAEGAFEQLHALGAVEPILLFHRTLSNYVTALLRTGFELLDVLEPKPSGEMLAEYPEFRDDLRTSHFIVFDTRKRAVADSP